MSPNKSTFSFTDSAQNFVKFSPSLNKLDKQETVSIQKCTQILETQEYILQFNLFIFSNSQYIHELF